MHKPDSKAGIIKTLGGAIALGVLVLVSILTCALVTHVRSVVLATSADAAAAALLTKTILGMMAGFLVSALALFYLLLNRFVFRPLASLAHSAQNIRFESNTAPDSQTANPCVEIQCVQEVLRDLKASMLSERAKHRSVTLSLQETQERTEAIFRLLPNGLLIVNQRGMIEAANEWVHSIYGYNSGELIGKSIDSILPERPRLQGNMPMMSSPIITSGNDGRLFVERKNGTQFPAEISVRQIPVTSKQETLEVYAVRDISQRAVHETERRKLSMAVEQCPSVIYITDPDGVIQYVNTKFTEVTGYSKKEAVGKKSSMLKSGRVPLSVYQNLWATITRGEVWGGELRNRAKDGRLIWVKLLISPMRRSDGPITHFIAALEDITEQRQIAAEMAVSEKRFRTLFEGAADAIFIYAEGGCIDCNSAALRLFQTDSKDTFLGKHLWELSPPIQPDGSASTSAAYRLLAKAHATGKVHYEWIYLHRDGTPFLCEVLLSTMELDGNTVLQSIVRDISDRQLAKLELEKAIKTAEAANQAKRTFLATMSHEIRTPLNAVINMTQLTLDTTLTSKQRQYLSVVNSSAQSLLTLINAILDFSKIEAGKIELESSVFSLNLILDEITDSFRGSVLEKHIEFIVHMEPDVPDELIGDSLRLRQVLLNLVGNAFKFTTEGEVLLRVTRVNAPETTLDDKGLVKLQFAVKDSGIGIPKDKQAKLFSAFTQVDSSTSRQFGGSGLGLAISKKFVELMGGEMRLESQEGLGSSFIFTALFLCDAPDVRPHVLPEGIRELRVLIIDDHENSRDVLKSIIARFGMRCEVAASGAAGMAMLEQVNIRGETEPPFGLVLVDYIMPDMDGFQVAEQIAQNPALASLPIIMVSAFAGDAEEHKAAALGIRAFVHKPITASHLFDATVGVYLKQKPEPTQPSTPSGASWHRNTEFQGVSILIAEDNLANQFVIQELLESVGAHVDLTNNGLEALDKLTQGNVYACALIDMQMPTMDGVTAAREIRRRWPNNPLPIIALTANAMQTDQETCHQAGMNDFLTKPINRAELFKTLRRWIDPKFLPQQSALPLEQIQLEIKQALTAKTLEDAPPTIIGVDVADALSRLEMPWPIFRRILTRFTESQQQTLRDLRTALDEHNWSVGHRHAHSIAGSSGNISAIELRIRAKALEQAIADQTGDVEALYASVLEETERVLKGIQQAISDTTPPAVTPPSTAPCDLEALTQSLALLSEQLDVGDVVSIRACMQSCREAGVPPHLEDQYQELTRLTEDYGFPEAAKVLDLIRANLNAAKESSSQQQ